MQQHDNLIDGEWAPAHSYCPTSTPPTWPTCIGRVHAGRCQPCRRRRGRRHRRLPGLVHRQRPGALAMRSTRSAPRSWRARKSSARCWRARRARPSAEGIGEATRAGHIFKFFAGECLRLSGETAALGAPGHRRRDHARADRRGRPHHALELPDRHSGLEDRAGAGLRQLRGDRSRPTWCPAAPGRWPRSSAARASRRACSTW